MGAADPCIVSLLDCEFQVLLIGGWYADSQSGIAYVVVHSRSCLIGSQGRLRGAPGALYAR